MKTEEANGRIDLIVRGVDGATGAKDMITPGRGVTSAADTCVVAVAANAAETFGPPCWSCSKSSPATATNSFRS